MLAEEADNNIAVNAESVTTRASYSYTSPANTIASDVCLRRTASTSDEIMLMMLRQVLMNKEFTRRE